MVLTPLLVKTDLTEPEELHVTLYYTIYSSEICKNLKEIFLCDLWSVSEQALGQSIFGERAEIQDQKCNNTGTALYQ